MDQSRRLLPDDRRKGMPSAQPLVWIKQACGRHGAASLFNLNECCQSG